VPPKAETRLAALIPELNAAHAACEQAVFEGFAHALIAGQLLERAKALVPQG
jgi:hypothetical protein